MSQLLEISNAEQILQNAGFEKSTQKAFEQDAQEQQWRAFSFQQTNTIDFNLITIIKTAGNRKKKYYIIKGIYPQIRAWWWIQREGE